MIREFLWPLYRDCATGYFTAGVMLPLAVSVAKFGLGILGLVGNRVYRWGKRS